MSIHAQVSASHFSGELLADLRCDELVNIWWQGEFFFLSTDVWNGKSFGKATSVEDITEDCSAQRKEDCIAKQDEPYQLEHIVSFSDWMTYPTTTQNSWIRASYLRDSELAADRPTPNPHQLLLMNPLSKKQERRKFSTRKLPLPCLLTPKPLLYIEE